MVRRFTDPNRGSPHFASFALHVRHAPETPETCPHPRQAPLSPVVYNPTDWRKPVDGEGGVGLPDDHGWDGNGGGLPALTPLLIHKVQIAMHPGHLVRGEAVGAIIICGDKKKKRNRRDEGFNCQGPLKQG